jgi:hypothetical protein
MDEWNCSMDDAVSCVWMDGIVRQWINQWIIFSIVKFICILFISFVQVMRLLCTVFFVLWFMGQTS